jgi:glutamate synthase domain-containing protein 1
VNRTVISFHWMKGDKVSMSYEAWHKGYQEIKNTIHNDMGVTKEEILDVFRQVAKDEMQNILSEKRSFIYDTIQKVIRKEMMIAIHERNFPHLKGNIWNYTVENKFKDYVADTMKSEILDTLANQFELNFDIKKK